MKTTLKTYFYDTDRPQDREPYYQLKTRLEKTPGRGHKMHALKSPGSSEPKEGEIILETDFLFENQWNSNVGRVFDWYEEAVFSYGKERANIKRGHYLEITPEMVSIRATTLKCGYTGAQFPDTTTPRFNLTQAALGSPYLKESELYLLRLARVCDEYRVNREPLTEEELKIVLPKYIDAQTKATGKVRDEQREGILKNFEKVTSNATLERDGMLWLLDHGMQLENVIFYNHTRSFSFGWRTPYTGEARLKILDLLKQFPFEYDVK